MPEAPEPGWYADPADAGRHRYWDGTNWTGKTRPAEASAMLSSGSPQTRQTGLWIGLAVGILAIAGIGTAVAFSLGSDGTDPDYRSDHSPLIPGDTPDPIPEPGPSPTTFPSDVVVPEGWILHTSETGVMSYAVDPSWENLIEPGDQDLVHSYYSDEGDTKSEWSGAWLLSGSIWAGNTSIYLLSFSNGDGPVPLRSLATTFASADVDDIEYLLDEEYTSAHGYEGWRLDYMATYGDITLPESLITLKAGGALILVYGSSDEDLSSFSSGMLALADSIVVHHPPAES